MSICMHLYDRVHCALVSAVSQFPVSAGQEAANPTQTVRGRTLGGRG